jgi:hypothetical protein
LLSCFWQWTELGETYLSIGAYKYGAFCFEELVLFNPMDSFLHSRLGDVRFEMMPFSLF